MNWRLDRACAIEAQGRNEASSVKLRLLADHIDQICIGLCLLREGLVSELDLVDVECKEFFRVKRSAASVTINFGKDKIVLELDDIELERWLHIFLRTVRDGVAEVDHFDLEAPLATQPDVSCDVVVAFPSSLPSVGAEEVRRRLGL